MLRFSILFVSTLIIVTLFGLGGSIVAGAISTAKILLYVLFSVLILSLVLGPSLFRRR